MTQSNTDNSIRSQYSLRDRSKIQAPEWEKDYHVYIAQGQMPNTFNEAMQSDDKESWLNAMKDEIASLAENEVWELVALPSGKRVINSRWVLRIKTKADGKIDRFKARLVAKGYAQKYGIDYDETFSPVARFDTIRTVLAVAANEQLKLKQFDVKTAFLYGKLNDEIYMTQPDGFNDGSGRVCKLNKSIYGLKQSPRCWNARLVNFLTKTGLKQSIADPCLFVRNQQGRKLVVAIYVDDGLIAGSDDKLIDEFITQLKNEFQITVSQLENFLGMQIVQKEDGTILVHQSSYVQKIIDRFNMTNANKVATPLVPGEITEDQSPPAKDVPYREAVGSLMFLMIATRPDLAYAVGKASRVLDKPKVSDWSAVKRIFKYLQGTKDYGIKFHPRWKPGQLEAYSDASYAEDRDSGRSTSGVVCKYSGGIISWKSQKQSVTALSTTEAELIAACEGAKEIIWLTRMLNELSHLTEKPVLQIDNQSTLRLIGNPEFHNRTKHIKVRFYYVREKVEDGEMDINHVTSDDQLADIMTKPFARARFERLREMIGVRAE